MTTGKEDNAPPPIRVRLWMLFTVLILPAIGVCLPALFVTYFFGQRPAPKKEPPPAADSLRTLLDKTARETLPDSQVTVGAAVLSVPCAPGDMNAYVDICRSLAQRLGGSIQEGLGNATARPLIVSLPPGAAAAFRQFLNDNAQAPAGAARAALDRLPATSPVPSAPPDVLMVTIQARP